MYYEEFKHHVEELIYNWSINDYCTMMRVKMLLHCHWFRVPSYVKLGIHGSSDGSTKELLGTNELHSFWINYAYSWIDVVLSVWLLVAPLIRLSIRPAQ